MDNVPSKKSRLGKNKKKAWRKVDISEVEDFLEDERLQERTGGLVADRPDEQLFVVDKAASTTTVVEEPAPKRKRREPKALKCHSHLVLDTRIKPARVPHNVRQESLDRRHRNVIEKIKSGVKTKTEIDAENQRKRATAGRRQRINAIRSMPKATYDLWGDEKPDTEVKPTPKLRKQSSIKVPSLRHNPCEIKAVEVPHPGASYNPAFQDYQELLQKAHEVEVKKVREERKIQNALDAKFPSVSRKTLEETWLSEMSAGLDDDGEPEENIDPETLSQLSVNPPVRREDKKTKTQRNKEKRKKKEEKMKAKEKSNNAHKNEMFRLKKLKNEVKARELRLEKRAEQRHKQYQDRISKTRKLGRLKFEDQDLEVKLSDELTDSLRKLKPEGNLLYDRYKSFQKRNILEPRQQAKKYRKYKKKLVEKRGHRNITL